MSRHGTVYGYTAGCRELCCTRAKKADNARRARARAAGRVWKVDATPTKRRLDALRAMGWSIRAIAREMGVSYRTVERLYGQDTLRVPTAEKIKVVYRRLSITYPPQDSASKRARTMAQAQGLLSPVFYADIETGARQERSDEPSPLKGRKRAEINWAPPDRFDEDLIARAMASGDFSDGFNKFEKSEILRRWKARGKSEAELCRLTGWKAGRYHDPRPEGK